MFKIRWMDGYHKKSRYTHGRDVQKAELKSYGGTEVVKTPT